MSGQLSLDGFAESSPQPYSLFFALLPDAIAAGQAAGVAAELARSQGTQTRSDRTARFHVTLFHVGHFAGEIPAGTLDEARAVADGLSMSPFDIGFDHVGHFAGKPGNLPMVLLGAESQPALMAFQATLQDRLLRAGLTAGVVHKRFTPHLTLFYGRRPIETRPIEPIRWHVDSFFLLRSVIGQSRYIEEGRWRLDAPASTSDTP